MPGFTYSDKHAEWLQKHHANFKSYDEITEAFNNHFKINKSKGALQQYMMKKLNLYLDTKRKSMHYSEAEKLWLIDNYANYETYADMTRELNSKFGRNHSVTSVREKCTKGIGLKGMDNPTSYKKGNAKEQCPIGTIRVSANGCSYIKVLDSALSFQSGYNEPYWLPLQKKVWLDHGKEVPEGYMVIFLDGNRKNIAIENLYCINRKISAILAANGWYSSDPEITLTAIKWCELYYSLKETT